MSIGGIFDQVIILYVSHPKAEHVTEFFDLIYI